MFVNFWFFFCFVDFFQRKKLTFFPRVLYKKFALEISEVKPVKLLMDILKGQTFFEHEPQIWPTWSTEEGKRDRRICPRPNFK